MQLDAAAKRSDVDFDTLNVNGSGGAGTPTARARLAPGAVNAGAFSAMPFALSFTGDYGTLGNFLSRLERFVTLKGEEIARQRPPDARREDPAPPGRRGLAGA